MELNCGVFRLCAFADEAAADRAGQIRALRDNRMSLLEIRNVDGVSIADLPEETARRFREELDEAISRALPQKLVMDFTEVSFMDSSGIGLIMGRYKQLSIFGGQLVIAGLSVQQKKVMRLAGLDRLCSFEETGGNRK